MTNKLAEQNFKNETKVIGLVSENKLKVTEGVERKLGDKVIKDDRITGKILIETGNDEVHEVEVFLNKTTNAGAENKKWAGLLTVANEYKSIASHGRDEADLVEVSSASFESDQYFYNGNEGTKDKIKINAGKGFINRLEKTEANFEKRGAFADVDIVVSAIRDEVDREGIETGRKIVEGYYANVYNGNATTRGKSVFVTSSDEATEYVESNYVKLGFVNVFAKLVNIQKEETVEIPRGFGAPEIKTKRSFKRENQIIGGGIKTDKETEETMVFTAEELNNIVAKLNQYIAEQKDKGNTQTVAPTTTNKGFGAQTVAPTNQTKSPFDPF